MRKIKKYEFFFEDPLFYLCNIYFFIFFEADAGLINFCLRLFLQIYEVLEQSLPLIRIKRSAK